MKVVLDHYQAHAVKFLMEHRRGVVVSPAGSGKTIIAAAALRVVAESKERDRRVRVGWMCNTKEQGDQAFKAALAVWCGVDAAAEVAVEEWRREDRPVDLSVACAAAGTDWSDRDVLVVDEAHHAPAPGWREQVESCAGARWGFTATPPEDSEKRAVFEQLFGGSVHVVPRDAVKSRIAAAKVVILSATDAGLRAKIDAEIKAQMPKRRRQMSWVREKRGLPPASEGEVYAQVSWQACIDLGIVVNRARNTAARLAALKHVTAGDSVLMLVNQVEHARAMALNIGEACWSGMGAKKRRDALARFKSGSLKCVVATSLCDEGIDIPRANVLVLVSGGRSSAKVEQRTGRVLRQFSGKTHGLIYDFIDNQHGLMYRHSQRRIEIYKKLGYEVTYE